MGPEHRDAFVTIHADPRTNAHTPGGPPGVAEVEAFFESLVEAWKKHLSYWAVDFEGAIVGFAGAEMRTILDRECWNLYYRFAPEGWHRGFATEAVQEAVRVAGGIDRGRPLIARTRASNAAAIGVAERAGLTRRSDLDHDGYTVLAANW